MQFWELFYAILTHFKHTKLLLDAFNSSNTLHYIPKKSKYSIILSWNVKKLELKWTKLFKNDNFQRFFILLWRLFMGFLKIGSQNYFKIKFFLLTNTYILICMWRNVRFKKFDLCLSWGYMCIVSPWLSGWWCPKMSKNCGIVNFRFTIISGFSRITVMII